MIFSRDELFAPVQEPYAEWSSIPLYSTEANDAEISQTANQFDDFINEADQIDSFDELINKNCECLLLIFIFRSNLNCD